jgi:hypothetical protein
MDRLLLIPFLLAGILILVFHRRVTDALQASNHSFYSTLLGEERAEKFRGAPDSRRYRAGQAYGRVFVILFGLGWIALSVYGLVAH